MPYYAGAFVAGAFALQWLPWLPDALLAQWLGIALPLMYLRPRRERLALCFGLGMVWAALAAGWQLHCARQLLAQGPDVSVTGTVSGMVYRGARASSFQFDVLTVDGGPLRARLQVRWYRTDVQPKPGETWRLALRVKPLARRFNPGGRDRAGRDFRRGLHARAYVLDAAGPGAQNMRLQPAGNGLLTIRAGLNEALAQRLGDRPAAGLVRALTVGLRDGISTDQWEVLRRTGTAHLVAISGLHIGLVATLVFAVVRLGWRYAGSWPTTLAAPRAAALAALGGALGYAALAGFSLPTQRALCMCLVACLAAWWRIGGSAWRALGLALVLIALWQPSSLADPGLWLSAGAVAALLFGLQGGAQRGGWRALVRAQWVATIGLAPLALAVFGQATLSGLLANLFAVPVVGFVVVPLALFGAASLRFEAMSVWCLGLAAQILEWLWVPLEWLARWSVMLEPEAEPGTLALMSAAVGAVLLLSRMPGRWLGVLWLLPAVFPRAELPDDGEFEAWVLDVGQGLSVLVRTRSHALLYDTGSAWGESSVAQRDVVPALRALGVGQLDVLAISHPDLDHAGGAAAVIRAFPGGERVGRPRRALRQLFKPCRSGQRWRFDGVTIQVLHPAPGFGGTRNNRSCVLRVASRHGVSLLLPGDIEAEGERALVARYGESLASTLLVAPHHGSKTSSGSALLDAVRPAHAVVPAGAGNRFGFPHRAVVARYRARGVDLRNTAKAGAVQIRSERKRLTVKAFAPRKWRYWHAMTCAVGSDRLAGANAYRVGARACWN